MKLTKKRGIAIIIFAPVLLFILYLLILRAVYPFWVFPALMQDRGSNSAIFLTMDENSLTRYGATFIYHNESGVDKITGDPFSLQIRVLGAWHHIFIGATGWNDIGYIIPANGTFTQAISWSRLYGRLPNGRFRFVTDVRPDARVYPGENPYIYLIYEFSIRR